MNFKDVIQENKVRRRKLSEKYDPVSGFYGAYGSRVPFSFKYEGKNIKWHIPKAMLHDEIIKYVAKNGISHLGSDDAQKVFIAVLFIRCKYDFEFWAAKYAKIRPKLEGELIPFVLNTPQRKLLKIILDQFYANKPIRIILCKARQWGGSTLIQIFMQWLQVFHYNGWNSVIVAKVESQAQTIKKMFKVVAKHHPAAIKKITVKSFEGSAKNICIAETDCVISIGSAKQPDTLRSQDIKLAHLSEVGVWQETEGVKPEDLIQTILGSVPSIAGTMVVEESTAKGVGNYFHRSWLSAVKKESGAVPVFVAWYEIPIYQEDIDGELSEFIDSFTDYDKFLWACGATLEGINWYRRMLGSFHGDTWRMNSEFPTTADEAFTSYARRVFPPLYVKNAEKNVCAPICIGELQAGATRGAGALEKISFAEQIGGNFKIWLRPDGNDNNIRYKNRYCGFLDIGGRTARADYSVLTIIDRLPTLYGGAVELAARWRGHTDQDLLAWLSARACKWYDNALLAVEVNSVKNKEEEADHSYTVLDEIGQHYNNLYQRKIIQKNNLGSVESTVFAYGFLTTHKSKEMILDSLTFSLRDNTYIEKDQEAIDEFNCFEEKLNGKKGAIDGMHDDIVISTAGAVWLATSYMPAVSAIQKNNMSAGYGSKIINEATF